MAKLELVQGTTSKLVHIFIQNSSVTTGAGLTGLTSATSGLTCYYLIEGAGSTVAVSLSAGTLGSWSSGGIVAVDAAHMPGLYELGLVNLSLASGASVKYFLQGAANMVPCILEIETTLTNNQDGVHGGLTALPNAAAAASGGLITIGTGSGQLTPDGSGNAKVSSGTGSNQISLSSGLVSLASGTQTFNMTGNITGNLSGSVGSVTGAVGSVTGAVGSVTGAVGSVTGNVGGSVASVTGNVGGNVVGSVASVTAAVKTTYDIHKNTALAGFTFYMVLSSNHYSPGTGLTVTSLVSHDGGAFASTTNSATEISNGWYKLDLAAADTNANVVTLVFTATGADQTNVNFITQT